MPLLTQRRNTAYLNRANPRLGELRRELDGKDPPPWTGLAIDLGGSLDQRFRPDKIGVTYLDELLTLIAPLDRRAKTRMLSS
jgi:hypothetical protein